MRVKSAQTGEGGGARPPLSLYLPSRTKLQCAVHLRGQIHFPSFCSIPICTQWFRLSDIRLFPPLLNSDKIRWVIINSNSSIGSHTTCFSLNTACGLVPTLMPPFCCRLPPRSMGPFYTLCTIGSFQVLSLQLLPPFQVRSFSSFATSVLGPLCTLSTTVPCPS